MLAEALVIQPIYAHPKPPAQAPSAELVQGWMIAYEQEKERRIEAEKALELPAVTDQERAELACLLTEYDFEDWSGRSDRSPVKYYSLKDADRLLAAGYRKVTNGTSN